MPAAAPIDDNPEPTDEGTAICGNCCRPCGGCRRTRFRRLAKTTQYFNWSFGSIFPNFRSRKATTDLDTRYQFTKCNAVYLDEPTAAFSTNTPYNWSYQSAYSRLFTGACYDSFSGLCATTARFVRIEVDSLKAWVQFSRWKVPSACQTYGSPHGCKYLISARIEFDLYTKTVDWTTLYAGGSTVWGPCPAPAAPTSVSPPGTSGWTYNNRSLVKRVVLIRNMIFDSLPWDNSAWQWTLSTTSTISSGCCSAWPGAYCTSSTGGSSDGADLSITVNAPGSTSLCTITATPVTYNVGGNDWTIRYSAT